MKKGIAVVGGLGLGATLMYFLDPDRGKRRRALVRDKAQSTVHQVADRTTKLNRDFRNRLSGMLAKTRSRFTEKEVSDDVVTDRVRAKLGRVCGTVGAVHVSTLNGQVTLKGSVPANESNRIVRAARFVRGVKGVDNQLELKEQEETPARMQGKPSIA